MPDKPFELRLTNGELAVLIRLIDAENEFQLGLGESFEPEIVSAREKLEADLKTRL